MCARLTACSKTTETATSVVEMRPCIHVARNGVALGHSNCHTCHITMQCCMHLRCVQVRAMFGFLRGDFSGISSTSHSVGLWSQDVRKTYALQQDGRDNDVRGGGEAVHSRGTHMAWVTQAVTLHLHAVLHAHAPRAGHVQCLDLRGDFGGISSTFSLGLWVQRLTSCSKAAETATSVVEMRPYIYAARKWRASLELSHVPSSCSAACTCSA